MAPRGLSAEEKRVRLLEIFHETKDFFQLKELEKLGPKMKGIVQQSVKEVLQGLVDDGHVQADKIGSSNFECRSHFAITFPLTAHIVFWSFPSERGALMNNRSNAAKEARTHLRTQLKDLQDNIDNEKKLRPDNDDRASSLAELTSTRAQVAELEKELAQYGSCDPVKIEAKRRATNLAHEAAIRWTALLVTDLVIPLHPPGKVDNVAILIPHMSRQNGTDPSDIRAYLEIGEDFEDIS